MVAVFIIWVYFKNHRQEKAEVIEKQQLKNTTHVSWSLRLIMTQILTAGKEQKFTHTTHNAVLVQKLLKIYIRWFQKCAPAFTVKCFF